MKRMMLMGGWKPKGKYSYSELVTMIGTDGYIPVANASELNVLRGTSTNYMGYGTPFYAQYLTGMDKKYVLLNHINASSYIFGGSYIISTNGIFDGNKLSVNTGTKQYFNFAAGESGILRNIYLTANITSSNQSIGY